MILNYVRIASVIILIIIALLMKKEEDKYLAGRPSPSTPPVYHTTPASTSQVPNVTKLLQFDYKCVAAPIYHRGLFL